MAHSHPLLPRDRYQFEFHPYSRAFQQPLRTGHGIWRDRQGILLKLTDDTGRTGFGEIAPLDWFGSESLEQALQFCATWEGAIAPDAIFSIPDTLPACQFGFEMAWENLTSATAASQTPGVFYETTEISAAQREETRCLASPPASILLPTGIAALTFPLLVEHGDQSANPTFKWKMGVASVQDELAVFRQLLPLLPTGAKLRLDANAHLTEEETHQWLEICQDWPQVEFLEQPLAPDQFDAMQRLAEQYPTPIALDESVATLAQLEACYQQGWCGIFVIKAAIAGSPVRLREFCKRQAVDVVWSSVFETAIAQTFIQTRLIPSVPQQTRAIGFGINHWFRDPLTGLNAEHLWQRL
jgi:O-succinylbenzoate synthase